MRFSIAIEPKYPLYFSHKMKKKAQKDIEKWIKSFMANIYELREIPVYFKDNNGETKEFIVKTEIKMKGEF